MSEPPIRITVGGKLALTVAQAAERYGLDPISVRTLVKRLGVEPDAHLDARTPLYLAAKLDKVRASMPGRGFRSDLNEG